MGTAIDQMLCMQDTMTESESQESTGSEIVSRDIDPGVAIIIPASRTALAIQVRDNSIITPPVTPFPIGTGGGVWQGTRMDPS